jgi:hypothetical protein
MKVCEKSPGRTEAKDTQSGPLRPVDTLHGNGPLARKSVSRNLSHGNGDVPQKRTSPYFTPRVLRKKTPSQLQVSNDEGPVRKKRRLEDSRERSMSKESPIVIEDDVEMGEQDELAFSSDKDQLYLATANKQLARRPTQPTNKVSVTAAARIDEFHAVEDMMNSSKHAARQPLQVLETNDPYDDNLSSMESSEDELFTKTSKQQRLESKGEKMPEIRRAQTRNGDLAAAEAGKPVSHQIPADILYTSSAKPANGDAESPDALQVVGERPRNVGRSSQVPLHQASGNTLAHPIMAGIDKSPSQIGRQKSKATNGKAKRQGAQDYNLRQLRFGPLLKDFDYMITIDEDHKTLSIRPQSPILKDEMIRPIPLRRISNIHHGENDCSRVMLVMSRAEGAIDDKMHLELESDKEGYNFVMKVQSLAGGNTSVTTKPRHAVLNPFHIVITNITQLLATKCIGTLRVSKAKTQS